METKRKIIKLFLQEKKQRTIREIAKALHLDYRITNIAAHRLINEQLLTLQKVGNNSLCGFNESSYNPEIYAVEEERKREILKNKDLQQLYKEIISKSNTSFFILILFGSYAKRTPAKYSDIDLMFISNEKDFEEKASNILSLIPLQIHPLIFTEDEFVRMKNAHKSNVIQEAMQHYILLYGIEAYYKLKNA